MAGDGDMDADLAQCDDLSASKFVCCNTKTATSLPCFTCPHRTRPTYDRSKKRDTAKRPQTIEERIGTGAGTELFHILDRKLFRICGVKISKTCGCLKHARKMNQKRPGWCRDNIDVIIGWLEKEHGKQKIKVPFSELIARRLVLVAIRRAERKERQDNER